MVILDITIVCNSECATCKSLSRTDCLSCYEYKVLFNGECLSECPSGYYLSDERCLSCVYPCTTCSSAGACTSCFFPYFLVNDKCELINCPAGTYEENSACQPCSKACLTCYGPTNSNCIECNLPEGYMRDSSGDCYPMICTDRTYLVASKTQCSMCGDLCKSCSSEGYCMECDSGALNSILHEETTCSICPDGYGLKQNTCKGNLL
jgi:proprotein convertase subtilisin/kexin type 5